MLKVLFKQAARLGNTVQGARVGALATMTTAAALTLGFNMQAQAQTQARPPQKAQEQTIKIERLDYNAAPDKPEFLIKNFLPNGKVMEIDVDKMTKNGIETVGYLSQFDPCLYYTEEEVNALKGEELQLYIKTQTNLRKIGGSANKAFTNMVRQHLQSYGVPIKMIDAVTAEGRKLLEDSPRREP